MLVARVLNEHRESHCYPRYSRRTAPVMRTDMHKSGLKANFVPEVPMLFLACCLRFKIQHITSVLSKGGSHNLTPCDFYS